MWIPVPSFTNLVHFSTIIFLSFFKVYSILSIGNKKIQKANMVTRGGLLKYLLSDYWYVRVWTGCQWFQAFSQNAYCRVREWTKPLLQRRRPVRDEHRVPLVHRRSYIFQPGVLEMAIKEMTPRLDFEGWLRYKKQTWEFRL